MRALLIAAGLLAGCGGSEDEAGFEPEAVGNASAGEARAISEAEEMLDNQLAVPGGADNTMRPEPKVEIYPPNETAPEG